MTKSLKLIPVALFLFLFSNGAFSQVKFERVIGGLGCDYGYSVIQTADSGYVFAGTTTSFGNGNSDIFIVKTNSLGNPIWQKTYGGINIDQGFSISEAASDSGLVIAGYTNSFGYGGYDMYLIRTDKNGDSLWAKTYGGTDWDFAYSAQQTSDGGYIIAGGTYSFGNGSQDVYLVKTNAGGDIVWTKTFGGINDDEARSVKQTSDGGYIIAGSTKSFGDLNGDVYMIKTDSNGDTLSPGWTKTLGFTGSDRATEIIQTMDGGYISSGVSQNTLGGYNVSLLVKTDIAGDTLWTRRNGYPNDAASNTVCQSTDGGYVWTGKLKLGSTYEVYLFKYNVSGGYVFSFTLGSTKNEEAMSIKQTFDKGYIVVGNSNSFNNYFGDVYLFKTDSLGFSSGTITNLATGIGEAPYENSSFMIYPNPSYNGTSVITMDGLTTYGRNDFVLNIYNSLGQQITSSLEKTNSNNIEFNTSALNDGLYFIEIIIDNKKFTSKLVVKNQ